MSKQSYCNLIREVTTVLINRLGHLIGWPTDPQKLNQIRTEFLAKSAPGIDDVCGLVDGTLINIATPSENEPQYVDRYQDHSINSMVVCGPRSDFFYVSARWPGSVHDARVLRTSGLFTRFEQGWRPFPNARILGRK